MSRCSTAEEFQNAFRRYAEPTALFIPTHKPFASADTAYLHVCLKTGEILLEGEIEVRSSVDRVAGLYGRPGMTVRFVSPDAPNKEMLTHLVRARTMLKPVPLPSHLTARPSLESLNKAAVAALSPVPPSSVTDPVLQLAECALVDTQGHELGAFAGSEFTSTKMTPIVPVEPRPSKPSAMPSSQAIAATDGAGVWRGEGTQLVPVAPVAEQAGPPSQHVISAVNATPGTWAPDSTRTEVSPAGWEADDDVAPPPVQVVGADEQSANDASDNDANADDSDDDELDAVNTNVVSKASISQIVHAAKHAKAAQPAEDDTSTTGTISTPADGPPRADTSIPPPVDEPAPQAPYIAQTLKGAPAVSPRMRAESLAQDVLQDDEDADAAPAPAEEEQETPPVQASHPPPEAAAPAAAPSKAALKSYNGAQPLNVSEFHSARTSVTIDAVMPMPGGRTHRASLAPGGVTLSTASARGTALPTKRRGHNSLVIALGLLALAAAAFAVWKFVLQPNQTETSQVPTPSRAPAPSKATPPPGAANTANTAAVAIPPDAGGDPAASATPTNDASVDAAAAAIAENAPEAATALVPAAAATTANKTPKCKVAFAVLPPTATISMDGNKLGIARKVKSLPCGDIEVTVSGEQYADKVVKLSLKPGAKNAQKIQLARPSFEIKFISKPKGAQLRINGKLSGKTPVTKSVTGFEPQQIELKKPGYKPKSVKVTPTADATLEYDLDKK